MAQDVPTDRATPVNHGFGVDIGGSGVKGAVVDLDTGRLVGDRIKILTPTVHSRGSWRRRWRRSSNKPAGRVPSA